MKERPILFSGPMVKAIIDGIKTQTRRVMKQQPQGEPVELSEWSRNIAAACHDHAPSDEKISDHAVKLRGKLFPFRDPSGHNVGFRCPYGLSGDRLWVRETWRKRSHEDGTICPCYRADNMCQCGKASMVGVDEEGISWKPSIHIPRAYSRINLEITSVSVERLNEITEQDAMNEGLRCDACGWFVPGNANTGAPTAKQCFAQLWDSINGKTYPWESNPWVWVVEFKRAT